MEEKNYYLQDKENVCVVCGSEDSYIRKNILPHEYRKYVHRLNHNIYGNIEVPAFKHKFTKYTKFECIEYNFFPISLRYFPPMMKEHKSHDIVLMCLPCHQRSGTHDASIKQELEVRCDAPSATENGRKYKDDQYLVKIRSAGKLVTYAIERFSSQ